MSKKALERKEQFSTIFAFCLAGAVYVVGLIGYFWNTHRVIPASEASITHLSLSHFTTTGQDSPKAAQALPPKQKPQKQHKRIDNKSIAKPEQIRTQEGDIIEESILTRQEQSAQSQQSIASQASSAGEMDAYMKHVYEVIAKHYALTQRLKGYKKGEVKLAFKIDMSGVVFDIQVISSSGYAEIDNAAVKPLEGISKDLKKPNKIYTMSITLHYGNKNK